MDAALKKGVLVLVVVFMCFYIFTDPTGAATFAREASSTLWSVLVTLFEAILRFLDALFR